MGVVSVASADRVSVQRYWSYEPVEKPSHNPGHTTSTLVDNVAKSVSNIRSNLVCGDMLAMLEIFEVCYNYILSL